MNVLIVTQLPPDFKPVAPGHVAPEQQSGCVRLHVSIRALHQTRPHHAGRRTRSGKMFQSEGAYEAKTHLPQLLDRVANGEEIWITRNGRPVARLVPEPAEECADIRSVIAQVREFRQGRKLGNEITIPELIEERRRF